MQNVEIAAYYLYLFNKKINFSKFNIFNITNYFFIFILNDSLIMCEICKMCQWLLIIHIYFIKKLIVN